MTTRAVCLGSFLALVVLLIQNYNDYVLNNTLLISNHLPTVGTALLVLFAVVVNGTMRIYGRGTPFSRGELLLAWAMVGVAGGVGGSGLMRCLPGWLAAPAYLTTPSNEFSAYVLKPLPDWMLVSKDPDDPAVVWFMEGLLRARSIPWLAWLTPLGSWGFFALCLFAVMAGLCAFFFRQWSESERLVFPLVSLPAAMTEPPAEGKVLNSFFSSKLVWVGAAVPFLIHGINGLRPYFPSLPVIPTSWGTYDLFPDRPWSEFNLGDARIYFSMIGITFMLTTEVSLSLWFFYVLFKLTYVYVAWIGAGGTGFFGNWYDRVAIFETAGAVFAIAAFLCWNARVRFKKWVARVLSGEDDRTDLLSARVTALILTGGFLGMTAWLVSAGVSWWAAVIGVLLFVCVVLVLTRIVAEAGVLFVGNRSPASDFLMGIFPASWLTGPTVVSFMMLKGVMMRDLKEFVMPYVIDGVRAGEQAGLRLRPVLFVLGFTILGAMGVSAYARISTCYKYGGVNGDDWSNLAAPREFLSQMANYRKNPPVYDFVSAGQAKLIPVNAAHLGVGAGLAAIMLAVRARLVWWPLSPYGLVLCATYQADMSWFSWFLGWLAKALVMAFGGALAYRAFLPFFLGLVLGESGIATVWALVGLFTGQQGLYLLPD